MAQAMSRPAPAAYPHPYGTGSSPGNAYGGAVYIAGGTVNATDTTLTGNTAVDLGLSGAAYGGALCVEEGGWVYTPGRSDHHRTTIGLGCFWFIPFPSAAACSSAAAS